VARLHKAIVLMLAGLAVLLLVALGSIAGERISTTMPGRLDLPALAPDATPEQVAERYFLAQAAGDARVARTLGWKDPKRSYPDFSRLSPELRGLRGLTVGSSEPVDEEPGASFTEARQLVVEYERIHAGENGEPAGRDGRFVRLSRVRDSGRWIVVSLGTGP